MSESVLVSETDRDQLVAQAAKVRSLTKKALDTLLSAHSDGVWPYELVVPPAAGANAFKPATRVNPDLPGATKQDESRLPQDAGAVGVETARQPETYSTSTQSMVLHALAVSTGHLTNSRLVPAIEGRTVSVIDKKDMPRADACLRAGLKRLIGEVAKSPQDQPLLKSKTWGEDDPLTLMWLFELLGDDNAAIGTLDADEQRQVQQIRDRIDELALLLVRRAKATPLVPLLTFDPPRHTGTHHPFVLLRIVQLALAQGPRHEAHGEVTTPQIEALFRAALNTELANSSIRDGGFDPASLVFSLEGLVLLNADSVREELVDRVFEVLRGVQATSSHWRPVHPITTNWQGLILLPQSVEVANSFLRMCSSWSNGGSLFSSNVVAIRQYADWVLASSIFLPDEGGQTRTGWQSEHTYLASTIHLWATSQSVLFLEHFAAMLDIHVAAISRLAANIEFTAAGSTTTEKREANWHKAMREREPLAGLDGDGDHLVFRRVDDALVEAAKSNSDDQIWSILLYGPPGTGKTAFSQAIADALGFDFISISPSDFTRAGEAGVEARAQEVFKVLGLQSRAVILFDEIDRLLLDRDSEDYGKQGDFFQFMTPGMLTKINSLRQAERCVFIIATNYADRIDSAIKRPGRVDEHLLLLPPDLNRRRAIIQDVANKGVANGGAQLSEEWMDSIAKATPLYIYKELEAGVQRLQKVLIRAGQLDIDDAFGSALERLRLDTPTISLDSYFYRFDGFDPEQIDRGPWFETCMLAYLLAETESEAPKDWVRTVVKAKRDQLPDEIRQLLSA
ncbi:hypothetical protein GCM10023350_35930 [Nocardioides endophyticus]|uniref:AAA+ ATPase domain-containing protein n=1 Tax=Nocardioides endophyticus TaxID=1353775 RepID=A0ABP8Z6E2_9ACTN